MDERRRAICSALIRNRARGEKVSQEEMDAVWPPGSLKGLAKAEAEEEARCALRCYLAGADLSDVPPRGWEEGRDWFAMKEEWGPELQAVKLRNMIEASSYDVDYWDALKYITMVFLGGGRLPPFWLRNWNIEILLGLRSRPRRRRGNNGQPPYVHDRWNDGIAIGFSRLQTLGLGKMATYRIVADEMGASVRKVRNVISKKRKLAPVALPWECWSWPRGTVDHWQAIPLFDD